MAVGEERLLVAACLLERHLPERRGDSFVVPGFAKVPADLQARLREHRDALRELLAAGSEVEEKEQEAAVAGESTDNSLPATAPAAVSAQPEPVAAPVPYRLPTDKWEAAGIFVVNGIPTCSLGGDQRAARIISGEIPFHQAVAQREVTRRMLSDIENNARPFSLDEARAVRDFLTED